MENLMKNLDEENFDDSDSEFEDEFENSILENNEIEIDVSANFDEEADGLFSWKEVEGSEMINVLPFSSKVGLKVDAISFKTENDFFKLMLIDEILAVLVEETNRYAFDLLNLHGESSDKRKHASSCKPTDKNEILKFLGLILLMGHIEKDSIQDYWTTDNLIETPIFREVMPRDRFLMILKFLHFSDNSLKESRGSPTYDRLWKIRKVFDSFNRIFKEVYDPTENLSFDEVIIKFKGRVLFKQYIPKKRKQWGLKMYKIADATGYTYDMRVYLEKLTTTKPKIVADYNKHMGYVDLGDRMSSTYSFARRTRKWTKKLFFSLIDIALF
ncbi:piggyBac transposable element-derived protein 4 [Trichonephila clavipes]|nr:piggyBac transposable element-derived protein 4 [Trichonephila clavipes]